MASVFTIDDDHGECVKMHYIFSWEIEKLLFCKFCYSFVDEGEGDAHIEEREVVSISTWLKKPDVVAAYRCKIKNNDGSFVPW